MQALCHTRPGLSLQKRQRQCDHPSRFAQKHGRGSDDAEEYDLGAFSGVWSEAEAKSFERATEIVEDVDEEMWRS